MSFGVDYSEGYDIHTLTSNVVSFACRYVGYTSPVLPQTKILTLQEAQDLSSANISIVSNWEWTANRAQDGFNAGASDAFLADKLHQSLGGPSNKPIYFSVDYNSPGSDVVPYFQGLASAIGLHRVGVYGPYACVKYLAQHSLASWFWQTYAWSTDSTGTFWYTGNHIEQYLNGVTVGDMVLDYDRSMVSDFGQWIIGGIQKNFMEKQFDTVWTSSSFGVKSGIYTVVRQGFLVHAYSACYPLDAELTTVDWAGNAIQWQSFSNGCHAEYANGKATVYDATNKPLFSGGI
jgi:hypothetical protein